MAMHGVRGARWRPVLCGAAAGLVALAGCASGLVRAGDRFQHPELGYRIGAPPGVWRRVSVEGADLALRAPGGATLSVSSRCRVSLSTPEVLARHLRFGLEAHRLRESGPVSVDGGPGWMQVFDAQSGARTVRVKTVTRVEAPCVYDWVLVAADDFREVEPAFDAWWSSFRHGPEGAAP